MMKEYSILLPNEKAGTYRFVTMLILMINLLVFGYIFFYTPDQRIKSIAMTGIMLGLISLAVFFINSSTKKIPSYSQWFSFVILSILWLMLGKYLIAFFILCFAVIGYYSSKKFRLIFSVEKIIYPSVPVKTFLWTEVNNVMLKDNVLTIDLNNNKLIQAVIEKESSDHIDENDFNEFCREQLSRSAPR